VAVSPDGTRLATGGMDNYVRVWDTASGWQLLEVRHGAFCHRGGGQPGRHPAGHRPLRQGRPDLVRGRVVARRLRPGSAAALSAGHLVDAVAQIGMASRYRVSSVIVHRQNQRSACGFLLPKVPSSWRAAMICLAQAPCAGVSRFVMVVRRVPCSAPAAWWCCWRTCYATRQAPSEVAE
jgi:hypothetical protein